MKNILLALCTISFARAIVITNKTDDSLNIRLKEKTTEGKESHKSTLKPNESLKVAIAGRLAKIRIDSETKCANDSCTKSEKSGRCKTKNKSLANGSHDTIRIKDADKESSYNVSKIEEFLNLSQN